MIPENIGTRLAILLLFPLPPPPLLYSSSYFSSGLRVCVFRFHLSHSYLFIYIFLLIHAYTTQKRSSFKHKQCPLQVSIKVSFSYIFCFFFFSLKSSRLFITRENLYTLLLFRFFFCSIKAFYAHPSCVLSVISRAMSVGIGAMAEDVLK